MRVNDNLLSKWRRLHDHGDITAICNKYNYTYRVVKNALNGNARASVIEDVALFYKEKETRIIEAAA